MVPQRPFFRGSPGWGAVERLNLALLVGAEHAGVFGWIEIQTDNGLQFLREARIVTDLKNSRQMRLQTMFVPDPSYALFAETGRFGHGTRAPVSRIVRLFLRRPANDFLNFLRRNSRCSARTLCIFLQRRHATIQKPVAPSGRLLGSDFKRSGDLPILQASRGHQYKCVPSLHFAPLRSAHDLPAVLVDPWSESLGGYIRFDPPIVRTKPNLYSLPLPPQDTTEGSPQTDKHLRTVPLSLVYNWSMRGKPTEKMKPETARSVAKVLGEHVVLELEAVDRMYLNVYIPRLQTVEGVLGFIRLHRGHKAASTAMVEPITRAFVGAIERFAAENGVPVVHFEKGQRKDDVAARFLADFKDQEGVMFNGKAQEKCRVYRTEKRRSATDF